MARLKTADILREMAVRRAWREEEVSCRRQRLRAAPYREDGHRLEAEIAAHAAVAVELESLENAILGRWD